MTPFVEMVGRDVRFQIRYLTNPIHQPNQLPLGKAICNVISKCKQAREIKVG